MWNVTLEYSTTHFNVMSQIRLANPSPTFHTHTANTQLHDTVMVVVSQKLGRKCTVPGPMECKLITLSAKPQLLHLNLEAE